MRLSAISIRSLESNLLSLFCHFSTLAACLSDRNSVKLFPISRLDDSLDKQAAARSCPSHQATDHAVSRYGHGPLLHQHPDQAIGIRIDGLSVFSSLLRAHNRLRPGNSQFCSEVEFGYTNLPFKCPNLPLKRPNLTVEIAQTFR
jgi:hypothetical protein